jgi:hypothetical protein
MRRGFPWLILLIALAACGSSGGTGSEVRLAGHLYRAGAGWTIAIPHGWHAVPFSDSKDGITSSGVELSTVRIPPPALVPGFPIQVSNGVLPDRGIGLIIATDKDPRLAHGTVAALPLPPPNPGVNGWSAGSTSALYHARESPPAIETMWFRIGGTVLIATVKIAYQANSTELKALAQAISSLRPPFNSAHGS